MKYDTFLKKKKDLDLTIEDFAIIVGYSPSSVKKWKIKGETPKWVDIVVSYLEISKEMKDSINYKN